MIVLDRLPREKRRLVEQGVRELYRKEWRWLYEWAIPAEVLDIVENVLIPNLVTPSEAQVLLEAEEMSGFSHLRGCGKVRLANFSYWRNDLLQSLRFARVDLGVTTYEDLIDSIRRSEGVCSRCGMSLAGEINEMERARALNYCDSVFDLYFWKPQQLADDGRRSLGERLLCRDWFERQRWSVFPLTPETFFEAAPWYEDKARALLLCGVCGYGLTALCSVLTTVHADGALLKDWRLPLATACVEQAEKAFRCFQKTLKTLEAE